MTKVTFFEDYYCFEYQAGQGASLRIHYYLYSPVYVILPVILNASTQGDYSPEKTVFSSDFLPSRAAWRPKEFV